MKYSHRSSRWSEVNRKLIGAIEDVTSKLDIISLLLLLLLLFQVIISKRSFVPASLPQNKTVSTSLTSDVAKRAHVIPIPVSDCNWWFKLALFFYSSHTEYEKIKNIVLLKCSRQPSKWQWLTSVLAFFYSYIYHLLVRGHDSFSKKSENARQTFRVSMIIRYLQFHWVYK